MSKLIHYSIVYNIPKKIRNIPNVMSTNRELITLSYSHMGYYTARKRISTEWFMLYATIYVKKEGKKTIHLGLYVHLKKNL